MTHVVTVCAKRFYHVYVEDEKGDMPTEEILNKAKENLLQDKNPDQMLDPEFDIEPDDVLFAEYEYEITD